MDVKQYQGPFDHPKTFSFGITEPDISVLVEEEHNYSSRKQQLVTVDEIKQEIMEREMPKLEQCQSSDLQPKIEYDGVCDNVYIFPTAIKQESNTSCVEVAQIPDIKQEVSDYILQPKTVSELLASHFDLPTLKIESADSLDNLEYSYNAKQSSLKPLTSSKDISKKKRRRYPCPICEKSKCFYYLLVSCP